MELTKAKLGMVIFGIVAIAFAYLDVPTYLIQMCVVGIAAAGGWELRGQVRGMEEAEEKTLKGPVSWWHTYYWRVLGYAVSFAGFGLIADELVQETLDMTAWGHEWMGIGALVLGLFLISIKPRGKG